MQVQGKYDARVFLTEQMTRAQGLRLKRLSEEAYQPTQYDRALSSTEAARPHSSAGRRDRVGELLLRSAASAFGTLGQ
ncbi:hypothetical protein ABIF64_003870 [Bradyrhizobium japonicum]